MSDYVDNPQWISWETGKCPLKDNEVEDWEYRGPRGERSTSDSPAIFNWDKANTALSIWQYRVLKWKKRKNMNKSPARKTHQKTAITGPNVLLFGKHKKPYRLASVC